VDVVNLRKRVVNMVVFEEIILIRNFVGLEDVDFILIY
jgi:hypothetical protein